MDEIQNAFNYLNVTAQTLQDKIGLDQFLITGSQLIEEFEEQLTQKIQGDSLPEIENSLFMVENLLERFGRFFPKGAIDSSVEFNLMHYRAHYEKYNQKSIIEEFERDEVTLPSLFNKETKHGIIDAREGFENERYSFRRLARPFVRAQLKELKDDMLEYILTHDLSTELMQFSNGLRGLDDFDDEFTKQIFHTLLTYDIDEIKSVFLWHILGELINRREHLKRRYFPGMFYERSDFELIDRIIRSKGIVNVDGGWQGILIKGRGLHPYLNGIPALVEALQVKGYINKKITLSNELSPTEIVHAFCTLYEIKIGERTARDKALNHQELLATLLSIIPSRH